MASEEAVVLSWGAREFCVKCPFCGGEEDGRFRRTDRYSLNIYKRREYLSRCGRGSYTCLYPFDEKRKITWYEIDELGKRYVNTCVDMHPDVELWQIPAPVDPLSLAFESISIDKHPLNSVTDCKEIDKVLGHSPSIAEKDMSFSFTYDPSGNLFVLKEGERCTNFNVPRQVKTVAMLKRGLQFDAMASMSGRKHDKQSIRWSGGEYIKGKQAISEVFRYAKIVGYTITRDHRDDPDDAGQFFASHAEKQLIVEFLNRHVLMPVEESSRRTKSSEEILSMLQRIQVADEEVLRRYDHFDTLFSNLVSTNSEVVTASTLQLLETVQNSDQDTHQNGDDPIQELCRVFESSKKFVKAVSKRSKSIESEIESIQENIARLSHQNSLAKSIPPVSLRDPVILVSSPMCVDCRQFLKSINDFYHLQIRVYGTLAKRHE